MKDMRTGHAQSLPVMCQHCADPPCVDVCPTGASFKRADGIVLVDRHTCIGCRYCMMACPYKARSFVHEAVTDQKPDVPRGKGCVEACTLCVHRIDRGESPPASRPAPGPATRRSCSATSTIRERNRAARRRVCAARRCAPTCGSNPACATRGCDMAEIHRLSTNRAVRSRRFWALLAALGVPPRAGRSRGALVHGGHGHIVTGMNNQIVWGMPHVFAIFLIVAASGVLNVASIASVFGKTAYKPLAPLSGLLCHRAARRRPGGADARPRPARPR